MKVLLMHKFFHVTGGAEVFMFETARVLREMGHEVAFMSTLDPKNEDTLWSEYFTAAPDFRSSNRLRRAASIVPIVSSTAARKGTERLLRDFNPDIAHAFNIFTHLSPSVLQACSSAGVPVAMTCNDYKHICPNYKLFHHDHLCEDCADGRFHHAIQNRCCQDSLAFSIAGALEAAIQSRTDVVRRNVDTFLFSSDFMAAKTEEFWGQSTFKWRKLRNPFDSTTTQESTSLGSYVLFIGRFVEEKGADLLIRAAAGAPHVPVVLVGEGPDEEALRQLANSIGADNVTFAGPKWGPSLDDYIDGARCVVVPSVWHENYPYVILQAFARGKAVVGSCRGGIPELVHDGVNGVLFDPSSDEALSESLNIMWANPVRARELGHAAKEFADENFNPGAFSRELLECYKEVLG